MIVWDNGSVAEVAAALDRLAGGPGAGPPQRGEPRLRARQQPRPRPRDRRRRGLPQQRHHRPARLARPAARRRWPTTTCSAPSRCCSTRAASIQSAGRRLPHLRRAAARVPRRASRSRTPYGVEGLRFHALTGAALALRVRRRGARCAASTRSSPTAWRTSTSATGWRGAARRATSGSSPRRRWCTTSRGTPGRYDKHLANRARLPRPLAARASTPRDDAALWATRGLRVVDHEVGPARHGEPPRLRVPRPVLVREARLQVSERTRLRWAIKNPAPAGAGRRALGRHPLRRRRWPRALRDHGQEVVVDRRPEWDRRHRPPRRRRAGAARAGPPRPEPRAGLAALGDLAPRATSPPRRRTATTGCSPPARPWAERRARDWALRDRAAAAGHRPRAVPPRRRRPGHRRPGALRRQLAPPAAPGRPRRARGGPPARGVRRPVVRPGPRRGGPRPVDPQRRRSPRRTRSAGRGPQRPPRRHARRRVRLQPALRRRRQRRPGHHRPGRRAGRAVRPLGPGLRDPRRPAPGWPPSPTPTPSSATSPPAVPPPTGSAPSTPSPPAPPA